MGPGEQIQFDGAIVRPMLTAFEHAAANESWQLERVTEDARTILTCWLPLEQFDQFVARPEAQDQQLVDVFASLHARAGEWAAAGVTEVYLHGVRI